MLQTFNIGGDKITIQPNTSIPNNTNNNTQNNGTNGSNGNGTKPPITPGKTAYFNHVGLGLISTITLIVTFYWNLDLFLNRINIKNVLQRVIHQSKQKYKFANIIHKKLFSCS